jgi:hypothetical protein
MDLPRLVNDNSLNWLRLQHLVAEFYGTGAAAELNLNEIFCYNFLLRMAAPRVADLDAIG